MNLQLYDFLILLILLIITSFIGYNRGLSNILNLSLFVTIAYIICVDTAPLISSINRFYANIPKLAAFIAGQDPSITNIFSPLIDSNLKVPLFFRFTLFIFISLAGNMIDRLTNKGKKAAVQKPRIVYILGALIGLYTGLLYIAAIQQFSKQLQEFYPSENILSRIPDFSIYIPLFISIYFIFLLLIFILQYNFLRNAQAGSKKKTDVYRA